MRSYWESKIGCLVAGAGVAWLVHAATLDYSGLAAVDVPRGPIGACGIGVLIWIHAKWRLSINPERF